MKLSIETGLIPARQLNKLSWLTSVIDLRIFFSEKTDDTIDIAFEGIVRNYLKRVML
jgi:hypothetical protein